MLERHSHRKGVLRFLGYALSGLGLLFVGFTLYRECGLTSCAIPGGWPAWLLGASAFTIGLATLGPCWSLLVWRVQDGDAPPSLRLAGVHYSAQIAKYLPGNVFHYAFRHAGSRGNGRTDGMLLDAALLESLVFAATAVLVSGPCLFLMWRLVVTHAAGLWLLPLLLLGIPVLLYARQRRVKMATSGRTTMVVLAAVACAMVFFIGGGVSLWVLLAEDAPGIRFVPVLSAFALSWLCGYVTPGLPGGIGVRESVLIISLDLLGAGAIAATVAIGLRLMSIFGDVFLWLLGGVMRRCLDQLQLLR